MKLSKNKIKHLLKVKNQSQKRIHKKINNRKKKQHTERKKKHTNLRHKTLRRMKGGGQQASSMKTADVSVQEDFKFFKAKFLEQKRELDTQLNESFTQLVGMLNALNVILTDAEIARLQEENNDAEFINNLLTSKFNMDMSSVVELMRSINSELNDIVLLFTNFGENTKELIKNDKEQKYSDMSLKMLTKISKIALAFPKFTSDVNEIVKNYNSISTDKTSDSRRTNILNFISKNDELPFENVMEAITKYLLPMQLAGEVKVTPEVLKIEEAALDEELRNLEDKETQLTTEERSEAEDIKRLLQEIDAEDVAPLKQDVVQPPEDVVQEPEDVAQEIIVHEDIEKERKFTNELVEKMANLSNQLQELEIKEQGLKNDLEVYKNMGEAGRAGAEAHLEEITNLQRNINELEQEKEALQREEGILRKELNEREQTVQEEKRVTDETITAQQASIDTLKGIIQELMLQGGENTATAEQTDELNRSREAIAKLEEELKYANTALGDREQRLNDVNEKEQVVIKNLQDTISSLEQNPELTKEQLDELDRYKNQIVELKQTLNEAEETSQTNLGEQQDIINKLQDTISSFENNPKMTEQQYNDINELKNSIKLLEDRLKTTYEELENREEIIEQLEKGKNVEQTTERRGLQEFLVRIKYPVPGSDEHVINVIGDSGTTTEGNIMNISGEINEAIQPPPYEDVNKSSGGAMKRKKYNANGLFRKDELIIF